MKIKSLIVLVVCTIPLFLYADFFGKTSSQEHARSFLYTRPFYDYLFLDRLFNRAVDYKKGKLQADISILGAHQQSTHNQKTTHYFLAEHRNEISIAGDNTPQKETREFRAEWIGLPDDFFAVFTIKPKQKQDGVSIEWIQALSKFTNASWLENSYVRILLPFYSARNQVEFESTGNTAPALLQAFGNPAWLYGHIIDNVQHKTALAKVELGWGARLEVEERLTLLYEFMLAIPTGNKQNAETLFQPVVGSNKHVEIGGRFCVDYNLCEIDSRLQVHFFADLQGTLYVKNHQHRTIDLKNKPLSRYLLFNKKTTEPADINIPGVNVLTRKCSVRPYMIADCSVGLSFFCDNFCWEFGYNVWGKPQERVELSDSFETEFILSDMALVEKRIESIKKQILKTQDEKLKREVPVLEKCNELLQEEKPLRDHNFSKEDLMILKTYQLLSIKPMLIALNFGEDQVNYTEKYMNELVKHKLGHNTKALSFFGQIEKEMADLSDEDAKVFMSDYGITDGFNPQIEFSRTKTLMQGDACCNHCYKMRL